MSEFNPTKEQKSAVELPTPLLVSAGAGSGKTAVLTRRLIERIKAGAGIDRFVIITFTRDAAQELKSRISRLLAEESSKSADGYRLRRQVALARNAEIGTIHSFCASLLRRFGTQCGIDPGFGIVSDETAESLRSAAVSKVMESIYENMTPELERLVNAEGAGRDDRALETLILELYEKMNSHTDPEQWAEQTVASLEASKDDIQSSPWCAEIMKATESKALYWKRRMENLLAEMSRYKDVMDRYGPSVSETVGDIQDFCGKFSEGWDAVCTFREIRFSRFGTLRNPENPEFAEKVKNYRNDCKKDFERLRKNISTPAAELVSECASTAVEMKSLLALEHQFRELYSKAKKERNLMDYSDLEHSCWKMLSEYPEVAERISGCYDEIMVDEYQDVSRVQSGIFKAVSANGKKLFMVGDIKQSIYRFRLADPGIFADGLKDTELTKVYLKENFRSCREVVDCCNYVFEKCMSEEVGDVDYGDDQRLVFASRDYSDGKKRDEPELILFEQPGAGTAALRRLEAAKVAEMIEKLGCPYGDVAILLRSANKSGDQYMKALTERGIPVKSAQCGDFFENPTVGAITAVLRLLDNPHNDIALLNALTGPLFDFTPDELAEIRSSDRYSDLYAALLKTDTVKCRDFAELIEAMRDACCDMSALEIINMIADRTALHLLYTASANGRNIESAVAGMRRLASEFEKDGLKGLHSFIRYLENLNGGKSVIAEQGSPDAVTIMSIHKSKGLQFPVVFLCDGLRQFNLREDSKPVIVHPELGLGPKVVDTIRKVRYPGIARRAISMRNRAESVSEEMRLLYVAMTRAREKLFITAGCSDHEKQIENSKGKQPADAVCYFDWLISSGWPVRTDDIPPAAPGEGAKPADAVQTEDFSSILECMKRAYPHEAVRHVPSKITATALKERDEEAAELVKSKHRYFRKADFSGDDRKPTPAEKGIATHLALQYMDFDRTSDTDTVSGEIERLRELSFLSRRQAECIDPDAIVKLFSSELGNRLRSAERMGREFKFSMMRNAAEVYPEAEGEQILLQGVVDCWFIEDGKIVIVDYKTDNVSKPEDLEDRAIMYSSQLKAYASALSEMLELPVKEAVLYFLMPGVQKTLAL